MDRRPPLARHHNTSQGFRLTMRPVLQKMARFQEYSVLGRKLPTEADPAPKL